MASENFTDKNAVFRKLKAKPENKVTGFWTLKGVFSCYSFWNLCFCDSGSFGDLIWNSGFVSFYLIWFVRSNSDLEFCCGSSVLIWLLLFFSICPNFRCVLIAMQRIQHGRRWHMGSFFVWIVLQFTGVLVFILAS